MCSCRSSGIFFFFFKEEDGIRYYKVTGFQTCALPISPSRALRKVAGERVGEPRAQVAARLRAELQSGRALEPLAYVGAFVSRREPEHGAVAQPGRRGHDLEPHLPVDFRRRRWTDVGGQSGLHPAGNRGLGENPERPHSTAPAIGRGGAGAEGGTVPPGAGAPG